MTSGRRYVLLTLITLRKGLGRLCYYNDTLVDHLTLTKLNTLLL